MELTVHELELLAAEPLTKKEWVALENNGTLLIRTRRAFDARVCKARHRGYYMVAAVA